MTDPVDAKAAARRIVEEVLAEHAWAGGSSLAGSADAVVSGEDEAGSGDALAAGDGRGGERPAVDRRTDPAPPQPDREDRPGTPADEAAEAPRTRADETAGGEDTPAVAAGGDADTELTDAQRVARRIVAEVLAEHRGPPAPPTPSEMAEADGPPPVSVPDAAGPPPVPAEAAARSVAGAHVDPERPSDGARVAADRDTAATPAGAPVLSPDERIRALIAAVDAGDDIVEAEAGAADVTEADGGLDDPTIALERPSPDQAADPPTDHPADQPPEQREETLVVDVAGGDGPEARPDAADRRPQAAVAADDHASAVPAGDDHASAVPAGDVVAPPDVGGSTDASSLRPPDTTSSDGSGAEEREPGSSGDEADRMQALLEQAPGVTTAVTSLEAGSGVPAWEGSASLPDDYEPTPAPRRTGRWLLATVLGAIALAVLLPLAVVALREVLSLS